MIQPPENDEMLLGLSKYLATATTLFFISLFGVVLNRKNIIILLMALELMFLSINLQWIVFSVFLDDMVGQLFALYVLTVAAAESAIGLAILVVYFRLRGTIGVEGINLMKG